MALNVYNVTLLATATRAIATHAPIKLLRIESETGNAAVQVGDSGVSATDYAATVTAGPTNAVTIGPFPHEVMNLDEFYFLGTEDEVIHLLTE
jgi:hypothetical protein